MNTKDLKHLINRLRERGRSERSGEAGDTLIELLVALTIIAIAFVGLLEGLAQSAMASSTHRDLTTLDAVMKSFAESARYSIQQAPSSNGSGPLYTQCASGYALASAPYPRSGTAGTTVTVFGTGFTGTTTPTVTVGGVAGTVTSTNIPDLSSFGNLTTTFVVPASGLPTNTPLQVAITDGNTVTAAAPFTVTTSGTGNVDSVASFRVGISSISYWGSSGFTKPCPSDAGGAGTDLQKITLTGTVPGASDTLSFVVTNPNHPLATNLTVTPAPTPAYPGQAITLTAKISPQSTLEPTPTGTVKWTISGPGSPSCPTTNVSQISGTNSAQATCSLPGGQGGQTYKATATYSGTPTAPTNGVYYVSETGALTPPLTISTIPTQTQVSYSGSPTPALGSTLTFTATVTPTSPPGSYPGEPSEAASDTISWSFPGGPVDGCSSPTPATVSGTTVTSTCTVTGVPAGTYAPTATFNTGADPNYTGSSGALPAASEPAVPASTPVVTVSGTPAYPAPGDTLTFTAKVAGPSNAPTPAGTVAWSYQLNGGPATPCPSTTPLSGAGNTATATCAIPNAALGSYTASATYTTSGANYNSAPAATGSLTVKAPPTMQVSGATSVTSVTFTATATGSTGGPAPTGTMGWSIVSSDGTPVSCSSAPVQSTSGNTLTSTCTISGLSTSIYYTATASYPGDTNYGDATKSSGSVIG